MKSRFVRYFLWWSLVLLTIVFTWGIWATPVGDKMPVPVVDQAYLLKQIVNLENQLQTLSPITRPIYELPICDETKMVAGATAISRDSRERERRMKVSSIECRYILTQTDSPLGTTPK